MFTLVEIDTRKLKINERYARDRHYPWVKKIHDNFNERLNLPLVVLRRSDGVPWVIDGGHRLEVYGLMGRKKALCLVMDADLTTSEEALLFVSYQNEMRRVTSFEKWRAEVYAGQSQAVRIRAALEANDLRGVAKVTGKRQIGALGTLQRIAAHDDALLERTLGYVGKWKETLAGDVIEGLAEFIKDLGPRLDEQRMSALIEVVSYRNLRTSANGIAAADGRSMRGHGGAINVWAKAWKVRYDELSRTVTTIAVAA